MTSHLNETKLNSQIMFDGKIIHVEKDDVQLEDGSKAFREVVRHSGGVCILALTDKEEVLLVKQFRYPHGAVTVELPAGKLEYGENHETCGKRELLEECGCTADSFIYLGKLFPTPAYCSEVIHMYLAKDLHFSKQDLDIDEFLDVEKMPFNEAVSKVLNGEFPDAKTQIAILKYAVMKNQA
ncbi:MAG: NUDIX hydrolase [Oscillospiraceae bacterium]|nr:NUDIX hydrolase [Oscillospiraceae bacterium]MDE6005654.1 NUDIX hydrolase [Oscillospiraceae bacterium]